MKTMAASQFKTRCLAVLAGVRRDRQPVLITRFGKPVAEVVPPRPVHRKTGWLGAMRGTMRIKGDIIAPAGRPRDWEALSS